METLEVIGLLAIAFAAGVSGGMMGVGGGVLFVPGLVLLAGLTQLEAEATSLVAVVVVGLVGAWRQQGYGNLRPRDAVLIGALSPVGVGIGALVANNVPPRALELGFAALMLYFAFEFGKRALSSPAPTPDRRPR